MYNPKAVYVHVPFCEQICHYCDFNKVFLKGQPVDEYLSSCKKEIETIVSKYTYEKIETIYIGGGTPTALSAHQLENLLQAINDAFMPNKDVEYTIEVNPGSASSQKLAVFKEAGINRLSIGVQAFQENILKKIGRTHNERDIVDTITNAQKFGFDNISIDLMFGLPKQTLAMFQETLEKALELGVPHFSAYSLKVEDRTVFHQLLRKGKLPLPSEDEEVAMYDTLIDTLTKYGYHHYEISNFAKPGFESKHNITYWKNEEYYGIGAGAHGYLYGQRYANAGPIKKYIGLVDSNGTSVIETHQVKKMESIEEEMFMGLRMLEGVSITRFQKKFGASPLDVFEKQIHELIQQGLLDINKDRIFLTRKGLFVANNVFEKFLL